MDKVLAFSIWLCLIGCVCVLGRISNDVHAIRVLIQEEPKATE